MLLILLGTVWLLFFVIVVLLLINSHRAQKRFEEYANSLLVLQKIQVQAPVKKKRGPYKKRKRLEHKKNPSTRADGQQ